MLQAFLNMWKIAELRTKLLFTLGMLAIYRIGFFIPLPAVNQAQLKAWADKQTGATGNLLQFMGLFTGGSFSQSTLFALGIMPYISASIIMQLLATVLPALKQLQDEGPAGRQKIQEYTRYVTLGICLIQGPVWLTTLLNTGSVYPEYAGSITFWITGVLGLTAGAVFLMWLGEQIDKYGIGNGASLIITAGIVAGMPDAIRRIIDGFSLTGAGGSGKYTIMSVIFLSIAFVSVVAGAVIITQGQRRIPIQQAKHTRGRRVYGGQKMYLPLRVNHGGVMPIIFASSLMMFPSLFISWMVSIYSTQSQREAASQAVEQGATSWGNGFWLWMSNNFGMNSYLYILFYVGLIYFFAYFWTTVQFQPTEMAKNLRNNGSFIPGMRPGPRTAEYLETVMERITYVGAGFLAIIAVIPMVVSGVFDVDYAVSAFLGGTGLLICVSVVLDMVQRIEAQLMMRNYQGFLSTGGSGKGPRVR